MYGDIWDTKTHKGLLRAVFQSQSAPVTWLKAAVCTVSATSTTKACNTMRGAMGELAVGLTSLQTAMGIHPLTYAFQ